jgi:hypothetical protein
MASQLVVLVSSGALWFKTSLGKKVHKTPSEPIAGAGVHTSHLRYLGSINRGITVQASPGIKQDTISKITDTKKAGGVAQVVDYLLSKIKVLNSTPSMHPPKKNLLSFPYTP